jgi:hypothetical protein
MAIVLRSVKGSPLTSDELDGNFTTLETQVAAKAAQGVGIASVTMVSNTTMQFQMTDHSYLPPITLPSAAYRFVGNWLPSTPYLVNDTFNAGGNGYVVLVQHTSATSFDPNATDGSAHNLYGLYFGATSVLPTGGDTGDALVKLSPVDFNTGWVALTLAGLSDVSATPPATGDAPVWDGHQFVFSPAGGGGGGSTTLLGLSDVDGSTPPTDGQIVYWNDGDQLFEFEDLKLQTLSDVTPIINSGPRYGDTLYYDDTTGNLKWYNHQTLNWRQMTVTGYTFSQSDTSRFFDYTNTTPTSVVIPTVASTVSAHGGQGIPVNCLIGIRQQNSGQVTVTGASGVTISFLPNGKLPKTRANGSVIWLFHRAIDFWTIYGDLADDPSYPVLTDAETIDLTASPNETFTYTPASNNTLGMASAPFGRKMTIVVTPSGTTSYTVTFGGGFKSSGPLVTGTTSGAVFTISFVGDGTNMIETDRFTGSGYLPLTGGTLSGSVIANAPIDSKSQVVSQSGSTLAINRALGEYCTVAMSASITTMTVTGWPASGTRGRVRMEIVNGGAFNITGWPTGTIWPGGTAPTITSGSGKRDMIELTSNNGGTTIYGRVLGQNFS